MWATVNSMCPQDLSKQVSRSRGKETVEKMTYWPALAARGTFQSSVTQFRTDLQTALPAGCSWCILVSQTNYDFLARGHNLIFFLLFSP